MLHQYGKVLLPVAVHSLSLMSWHSLRLGCVGGKMHFLSIYGCLEKKTEKEFGAVMRVYKDVVRSGDVILDLAMEYNLWPISLLYFLGRLTDARLLLRQIHMWLAQIVTLAVAPTEGGRRLSPGTFRTR